MSFHPHSNFSLSEIYLEKLSGQKLKNEVGRFLDTSGSNSTKD
jgi:hypothetical protein